MVKIENRRSDGQRKTSRKRNQGRGSEFEVLTLRESKMLDPLKHKKKKKKSGAESKYN